MSTITVDLNEKKYGRLLAKALPSVIRSEEENNQVLSIIEGLMAKGEDGLTPEEDALLELLVDLVHDFEKSQYPFPSSSPHEMVAFLLEQRGLNSNDLREVLGSKARVSEILSGKRPISKEQAKKLAAFFHVDPSALACRSEYPTSLSLDRRI